jgi:hypothetical protein
VGSCGAGVRVQWGSAVLDEEEEDEDEERSAPDVPESHRWPSEWEILTNDKAKRMRDPLIPIGDQSLPK